MRSTPTVYVICGFIGAGKTTFAKDLESRTNAVRITKDEWSIQLIANDPTIAGYADHDARIAALSRKVAFQLVCKGIDVILDEGFWGREERRELMRQIADLGANGIMYYLDTPIEATRARVLSRNADPGKDSFIIDREMLEGYLKHWQPPGEDEHFITTNARE